MLTTSSRPISDRQPWTSSGAPPLYATPRNPDRYSEGAQIALIAQALGTPLLPWQRYVADVATERRPDGSYEYQTVVVTVPRQTGKTTLIRAMGVHSALAGRSVFYTAQTGKDARARWQDLVDLLRNNPAFKEPRTKVARRGGSEHVRFPGGGLFQCFAPTPESLHGYTPPKVVIDEAFAQTGGSGELLMGAIGPAQFTIVDKQKWIVSTMGTAESTFFHDWVDKGMDATPRVACFYWGARDDQNPYDPADIAAFHPGVGFRLGDKTISPDDVLAAVEENSRAEYERAYANRRTLTGSHLIPAATWADLALEDLQAPDPAELVLSFDVDATRDQAAIIASWLEDGRPRTKVVQAGPGVGWLPGAVDDLRRKWRPRALAAVGNGPVLDQIAAVNRRAGFEAVRVLSEREYATASSAFLTAIEEATLGHDGDELLAASVVGLVTRAAVADGVAFSRRNSVGNSAPAIAAAAGVWVAQNQPALGKPVIYFGGDAA